MNEITDIPRVCPHDKIPLRAEVEFGRATDPGTGVSEMWLVTVRYGCERKCTEVRSSSEKPTSVTDTAGSPIPVRFV